MRGLTYTWWPKIALWAVFIGFMALLLSACDNANTRNASGEGAHVGIRYFKDTRTGICFASASGSLNLNSSTLTHVPCTPEVEGLVR